MEEKTLLAQTGPRSNPVTTNVQLNGVLPNERLTPKMARRAARIAFGHENGVVIYDSQANYGYRVYRNSARKFYMEIKENERKK